MTPVALGLAVFGPGEARAEKVALTMRVGHPFATVGVSIFL
jgi:hypothetical protein